MTQHPDPPKIEFPCQYPIKVLGRADERLQPLVIEIFERHAPGLDVETLVVRSSSGGKFVSLTLTIEATGKDQLARLHEELMATGLVSMVI
jgi:putative lipoic acid-binding regulatory protein